MAVRQKNFQCLQKYWWNCGDPIDCNGLSNQVLHGHKTEITRWSLGFLIFPSIGTSVF